MNVLFRIVSVFLLALLDLPESRASNLKEIVVDVAPDNTSVPKVATESITLPFLGKIPCKVRTEQLEFPRHRKEKPGPPRRLSFRVFTTSSGQFLRAEFKLAGSKVETLTMAGVESGLRASRQFLRGPVKPSAKVADWRNVAQEAAKFGSLEGVTRIYVTLVNYQRMDEEVRPIFAVTVRGAEDFSIDSWGADERYRLLRLLFEGDGDLICVDNLIF